MLKNSKINLEVLDSIKTREIKEVYLGLFNYTKDDEFYTTLRIMDNLRVKINNSLEGFESIFLSKEIKDSLKDTLNDSIIITSEIMEYFYKDLTNSIIKIGCRLNYFK